MTSTGKNRQQSEQTPLTAPSATGIRSLVGALAVIVAVGAFLVLRPVSTSPSPAPPPVSPPASAPAEPAKSTSPAGHERLVARWLRPDGGYILEIRSAAADGKLDAGYFNPNPIHVARAEWASKDGKLGMFVELRDVNYPGSTYDLIYDPQSDSLTGIYYQAALQQQFEVAFVKSEASQ
jgi:hypothetical protein